MRYQNWDVLIFPLVGDSKTPLQEFGTACTVNQDPDVIPFQTPSAHPAYLNVVRAPLPTVSCFIPSTLPGSPFRVSLHSWSTPTVSRETVARAPQENMTGFEAKVLLDGVCIAFVTALLVSLPTMSWLTNDGRGTLLNQDSPWPQTIDMCSQTDKEGNHDQLRFPPFHTEVLTQTWSNPVQNLGRIKIVIAEGINHGPGVSAFERTKNLVSFSFQHAPLHILESCGIAWPNQGLYFQAAQQFHNVSSPHMQAADPNTHAHSPRRRNASMASARAKLISPLSSSLSGFRPPGLKNDDPFWSQHGPTSDPFIGGANLYNYRNPSSRNTTTSGDVSMKDRSRSTSDSYDEPMPDITRPPSPATSRRSHPMPNYSHPQSLASSRQVSWYTGEDSAAMRIAHLNYVEEAADIDEQVSETLFNNLMTRLSPRVFSTNSGISAPSNTRVNSAANTPPGKSSIAAELRAVSFAGMPRSVSVTTRDPPPPFNARVPSKSSVSPTSDNPMSASHQSEIHDETGEETEDKAKKRSVGRPAGNVKSRKEGRTSEIGLEVPSSKSQRRASASSTSAISKENSGGANGEKSGEGKRKRVTKVAMSEVNSRDRLENQDSSPTRKLSKRSPEDTMHPNNEIDDLTEEGVVMRVPLRELDNIM